MSNEYSESFKKFHLGCGTIFLKNYLNIGFWTNLEQNKLYENPNGVMDKNIDCTIIKKLNWKPQYNLIKGLDVVLKDLKKH